MYRYLLFLCLQMLGSAWCQGQNATRVDTLNQRLKNPEERSVLVCAHRGDWRQAPENSLQAIQNCVDMGVDIVEIDIQQTKDGQLILLHDETLDRTTTGRGAIKDWTLDSLRTLYLRNGIGTATRHRIPTLREALELAKGQILLYLDKSINKIPELMALLKEMDLVDHAVFMLPFTYEQARTAFGLDLEVINFIPRIELDVSDPKAFTHAYFQHFTPPAFQLRLPEEKGPMTEMIQSLRDRGVHVCVSTLWGFNSAGHDDDLAVHEPDVHWGWHVRKGVSIFNTDRPATMLAYLRDQGLHD